MTHRYGRHGNNAWLRWRKKRFRRTALTPAPQAAVLHIPLEFLSRIRKVTIFMSDGTEETVEITTNPLSSPVVDADPIKRVNRSGSAQSPQDRFFAVAKEIAGEQAERIFRSAVDPYSAKLHVQEARALVQSIYYGNDNIRLAQQWSLSEAQEQFLREFRAAYGERLSQLSIAYEAPTEETQQLLVFARTDKIADESASATYAQDRAFARAYMGSRHFCPCAASAADPERNVVVRTDGMFSAHSTYPQPRKRKATIACGDGSVGGNSQSFEESVQDMYGESCIA